MNTTAHKETNATRTGRSDTRRCDVRRILDHHDLRFSSDHGWDVLVEHVERHTDFLRENYRIEPKWHEAVFSWYEEVFTPLFQVISQWQYRRAFGRHLIGDLYLAVSDHWWYLKEYDSGASPNDAARSFVAHYGGGIGRHFSRFLA